MSGHPTVQQIPPGLLRAGDVAGADQSPLGLRPRDPIRLKVSPPSSSKEVGVDRRVEARVVRPIYHQLEHRIEAYIFVAFLAYCLHVTLRAKLKPLAPGLPPRAVLDKLAGIQMLDVHFPTTDDRITLILSRYTELNADQKLLVTTSGLIGLRSHHPASLGGKAGARLTIERA